MELIDLVDELSEDELMDIINLDLNDNYKVYPNAEEFLQRFYSNNLIGLVKDAAKGFYSISDKYARVDGNGLLVSNDYVSDLILYNDRYVECIIKDNINNNTVQYILKQHNFESR